MLGEIFTNTCGKVAVVARQRKKRPSPLIAFTPLWVRWRGDGGLVTLSHCEPQGPGIHLTGRALFCGLYMNELLQQLCPPGEALDDLFSSYVSTLHALKKPGIEVPLRHFEAQLLQTLGYGLSPPQQQSERYHYRLTDGFYPHREGHFTQTDVDNILSRRFTCPTTCQLAKQVFRHSLDHLLPRPLVSRQLFCEIKT